jgi:hypothetical protein
MSAAKPPDAPQVAAASADIASLRARRAEMAAALAEQAAFCSARRDTSHPAFHGCIDWHSAVHGAWALAAFERRTRDARYRAQLEAILAPALLRQELAFLRADPAFEMPYGRAWFLRLASEWRALSGDDRLDALSAEVARSFRKHYAEAPPAPTREEYASDSWALINLLHYARARGDRDTEDFVVALVRAHFIGDDQDCDLAPEGRGFLSVCVTWAWLVSEALPQGEFRAWYARWNPGLEMLQPVRTFNDAHDYGRNFSRAWGLSYLAAATGDVRLVSSYAQHVAAGYAPDTQWRGDYGAVGHWVAQFGMLALGPLFEEP